MGFPINMCKYGKRSFRREKKVSCERKITKATADHTIDDYLWMAPKGGKKEKKKSS
jgi:hypothetical protein